MKKYKLHPETCFCFPQWREQQKKNLLFYKTILQKKKNTLYEKLQITPLYLFLFPPVEGATVAHYYRAMGPDGAFKPLHCTSMFTNKGRTPGATGYMESEAVVASLGRAFNLLVSN